MIERDYHRLKEECRLAGLNYIHITMGDDSIGLDIAGRVPTDSMVTIYYRFERKLHVSDTRKEIDEFKSIQVYSYQASSNVDFASIDSLFLHETFFRNWTKLIELSRK